ncbi:MAG: hypothetical protein U0892_18985 [Pirellulales bacterium]
MSLNAEQVLQSEYLQARAKILELAAILDRIDRAEGAVDAQPQMQLLRKGIDVLNGTEPDKAARVQLLFSRGYDPDWRKTMSV